MKYRGCQFAVCALLVSACGDDGPGQLPDAGEPDLSTRGTCVEVPGSGTMHAGSIVQAETWTAAGSPHRVTADLTVLATVTLEPCALVLLGSGVRVTIGSSTEVGSIIGRGTRSGTTDLRPVTFDAIDRAARWAQISVEPKGTLELEHAAIQYGGQPITGESGAIVVRGVANGTTAGPITRSTKLVDVRIERSGSYGLNLEAWGALDATSSNIVVLDSGGAQAPYAVRAEPGVVGTLPPVLLMEGNMKDEIEIRTIKTFMRDDTFHSHTGPYHVIGPIYVNADADGAPVKLTIDAGVTLAFEEQVGSGIYVGSSMTRQGILEAIGTPAAPIVFTSAKVAKAAGDWRHLFFRASPASGNRISNARIEYAGADSTSTSFGCGPADNDGAVLIQGSGGAQMPPASAFIDQTTFDNIAGTTVIVSGWIDDAGPNFSATNTFGAATPGCKVSKPRRTGGGDVCDGGRTTCWP